MRVKNVTYAMVEGLDQTLKFGERLEVRGSTTIELRNQLITLEQPRERCVITPARNNDVFIAIAETMWVLAGRNDLDFLSHYLQRASNFSDDGKTWRAAYGPRLRNWQGVDQIKENLALLLKEQYSRRSVISIFDPKNDFLESKDIPCNNWIHWLIRDSSLHMNIAIRSNDIIWGFSGINAFEWSVLHELMAFWLDVEIGEMSFFASSFHLYDYHEKRANSILAQFPNMTCYEYGLESPRFQTPWDEFNKKLDEWFELESKIRKSPGNDIDSAIQEYTDPLFRHFLELIRLYNGKIQGWSLDQINSRLSKMPETDFTTAAYEYFNRKYTLNPESIPQIKIKKFWSHYNSIPASILDPKVTLFEAIKKLHKEKTAAYGNSWKRRGEQISIMANIARKVDRLEHVVSTELATHDESLLDTAIDLFVYCIKYQTFLADVSNDNALQLFGQYKLKQQVKFSNDLEGFNFLLSKETFPLLQLEQSSKELIGEILSCFGSLEDCFLKTNDSPEIRLKSVKYLTASALNFVAKVISESPEIYQGFITHYLGGGYAE